ncbi:MAG: hypothetical protein ISR85_06710 [Kiritimatiellales bacterium]|nr:hypothetical protein [Kiritimatiellota bacterium]MBL7012601.1 hypothetical protein [Kiritimatiellales bacterium]
MHKILKFILMGLFALCIGVQAEDFERGGKGTLIQCEKDSDYSYFLRLPKNYDPSRAEKWPVLFVMSPEGGEPHIFNRYSSGADMCGWILALSVESKNANDGGVSHSAIMAMVEDVFDRFPVDEERCYASGMSGGGREAFWLANNLKKSIIGIIPCGAGDAGNPVNNRALAYGLSGSTCFNRWDMTITFNQRIKKRGVLRFFPGMHDWAESGLIQQAMVWLNGQYLKEEGKDSEIQDFSGRLMTEIKNYLKRDPTRAYEASTVLSEIQGAPDAKAAMEIRKELQEMPEVKTYLAALDDVAEFADDHFNTDVQDYRNNRTTKRSEQDSQKLVEKYKGTPYEELMRRLGEPTQEF